MSSLAVASCALVTALGGAPSSARAAILVASCAQNAGCYASDTPVPWSYDLSEAQLVSLGLGGPAPYIVLQESCCTIRVGATSIVFDTASGPVTESLPEFNGLAGHGDPCNACEVDTIGEFSIPANAVSATISGTFGDSVVANTAAINLYLGAISAVPEPSAYLLLISGIGALGLMLRRARLPPGVKFKDSGPA
jgi:hypothetical protein